jgi:two-component system cell cycle sensor histidine kinase/response regulator CckA
VEANSMKVLAIDDNQDNLTTLKAVLQDALPECALVTALDGAQGIDLARTGDPDVILLDIVMPGMDGFDVCRRLKTDERLRSIPVVFLTALRTDRESRVKALEVGAEAFVSKPLDEPELVAQVRAMAKIKAANRLQRLEKEHLAELVAERTRALSGELAERKRAEAALRETVAELQKAAGEIKTLRGIVPICASCKKIRDDQGYWNQVEVYVRDHSEAEFSHGICPECIQNQYTEPGRADGSAPENEGGATDLRRQAEAVSREQPGLPPENLDALSPEETRRTLHELRAQQIELALQNKKLRRAQLELEAARARYLDLYELAPMGYCTVSEKGLILEANLTASDLLGVSRGGLVKQAITRFIFPEDQDSYYLHRKQLFETGELQACELRMLGRDGKPFWARLEGTAAWDAAGAPECRVVMRDITKRKRAEAEKATLEGQLQKAQKMEAIGALAGGIAHFNNILSVIIGNAEILNLADDNGTSVENGLNQILGASQRAKQLVHQILAFSRRGKQEKILINLKPIVKESLEFLRASLPSLIELRHYLEPDAGTVMADPSQMQQILMNLCVNAAHAMEKDGGVLQINLSNTVLSEEDTRFDPEVEPGDFVKLTVSDSGDGMEPSVLQRIFDPYFTTKEPSKGTGLGLSVVHGIVKSHGGMITVDSEVGKGTTFTVFLQRALGFEKVADKPMSPLAMGTETILFVDDENALADLGRQMLGELGYQVEIRSSPIEALEAFRANPQKFDLVVTDLTMPHMSGLNLARKLMEIRPGMPIILCTGFSEQANEHAASALGICAFLLKPLVMRDIADAVRKALDECSARSS